MIPTAVFPVNRAFLVIPIIATGLWFLPQKGCVPDGDLHPDPASAIAGVPQPSHLGLQKEFAGHHTNLEHVEPSGLSGTPRQSLKHAATLLRNAADVLDKNELLAVQLIRQVIAILKHHVIPSLKTPDAARISVFPPTTRDDHRALNAGTVVPRIPMSPCMHQGTEKRRDTPIERYGEVSHR